MVSVIPCCCDGYSMLFSQGTSHSRSSQMQPLLRWSEAFHAVARSMPCCIAVAEQLKLRRRPYTVTPCEQLISSLSCAISNALQLLRIYLMLDFRIFHRMSVKVSVQLSPYPTILFVLLFLSKSFVYGIPYSAYMHIICIYIHIYIYMYVNV